jgi:hypothetical protein
VVRPRYSSLDDDGTLQPMTIEAALKDIASLNELIG